MTLNPDNVECNLTLVINKPPVHPHGFPGAKSRSSLKDHVPTRLYRVLKNGYFILYCSHLIRTKGEQIGACYFAMSKHTINEMVGASPLSHLFYF